MIDDTWWLNVNIANAEEGRGGLYEQNNPRSCCWMMIIIVRIIWFVNMNTVASDIVLHQ